MPTDGDDEVPSATDDPIQSASDAPAATAEPPADTVHHDGPSVPEATVAPDAKSFADQMTEAADARRLLWPWVARRTPSQIIALVLISLLALGPAFALGSILRADPTPVNTLIEAPPPGPKVTKITVTATRMSPTAGEIQTRIAIQPADDLLDDGKLNRPVSVTVEGGQGATARTFNAGDTPSPFEVSLPLTEGNTSRYPFDSYKGSALIVVTAETDGKDEASLSVIEARSIVGDFDLSGSQDVEVDRSGQKFNDVTLSATRPATTTVYAVWLMILMWGLAVTGLLLVWAVVIWMVDLPFWAVGYLVGVLFALPPLRDSLPGRPPPGTIFDYGSFYWSITLIGVNLILVLVVWLRRVRDETHLRSLDVTKDT